MSSNLGGKNLGGGIQGFSARPLLNATRDSEQTQIRSILRRAWNTPYATGTVNGSSRAIGEFKAVNNIGDFLSRKDYACGYIPNPIQPDSVKWRSRIGGIQKHCDNTNVPCSNTNTKFVPDSSDYITYKKQRALNLNYNDSKFGGDDHHANYTKIMAIRRF
jgi:hypothetical protein